MPLWLTAAIKGAAASVAAFLKAIAKNLAYWFAYRLGQKKMEAKIERRVSETRKEQLDIAARPPTHRGDILDRMRDGSL